MNVIKESFKYTKKYTPAWIIIILIGLLTCVVGMLLPQVAQLIIDRIINPSLGGELKITSENVFSSMLDKYSPTDYTGILLCLITIMSVLLLIRYGGHYIRWNTSHFYGVRAEKDMRVASYKKMLDQNSLVMSRYTMGDLMSVCNSDTVAVKEFWSARLSIILDQIFAIGISIFFLARIEVWFIAIPLTLGMITAIVMIFYTRDLRKCYNNIREASVSLNSCVQENINGVRIIRSYASEDVEIKKFSKRNKAYKDSFLTQAKVAAKYNAVFSSVAQFVALGSTILGVIFALNGTITAGQFLTFSAYTTQISGSISAFATFLAHIQNSMICGERMFTFINMSNVICDKENPLEMPEKPNLSMRNVSIKLSDNEELKNITVDIPYGKKLGIMGKTGAGKSVMIKALTRLFETTYGETCINDVNIKNYRVEDVRRQFGYVMQDVFLFSNTVDSNIAFYDPNISHDEIVKAARVADADNFINKLSDGYNTIVGEKGLGLSGGQKQRLSIARALIKNAPVILLDDCTSALDLETERRILKGIEENYSDKTLIIASHRAASVVNCDEILYLDSGEIIERGTHDELLKLKGKYYEVFSAQAEAMKEQLIS